MRDNIGFAGDLVTDPFFSIKTGQIYWGFATLRIVDFRADRLGAGDILESASLDPYVFLRDAYLQRRQNLVYDGNPPESEDQADIWADVDFKDGKAAAPAKQPPSPKPPAAPPTPRVRMETFGG
jgi:phospholipid-binding lipoprotein MlaA